MVRRHSFSLLSSRAKALLNRQEGVDVEFKQSIAGLETSDIIAFANSSRGGAILIGVAEATDAGGHQMGRIVGCPTGDKPKLQILDKAMSCVPPVELQVFVDNVAARPFFRVEIPSGNARPYSTSGGTYKIREDGRVRALTPSDLLNMLLEREARIFAERFADVTKGIITQLEGLAQSVNMTSESIERSVEDIAGTLGWTDSKVDETASDISSTLARVTRLSATIKDLEERLISLVAHTGSPDPVKNRARERLISEFRAKFKEDPALIEQLKQAKQGFTISGQRIELFTPEEMVAIILEAAKPPKENAP